MILVKSSQPGSLNHVHHSQFIFYGDYYVEKIKEKSSRNITPSN